MILPKKQVQKLKILLISQLVEIIPILLEFLVVSIIGTYLRWDPTIIAKTFSAIVGNNITIIVRDYYDSKKTN